MKPSQTLQRLALELKANLMQWVKRKKTVFTDASYLSMVAAMLPIEPHNLQLYEDSCFCWQELRPDFKLCVSPDVITEISDGEMPGQIMKRLALVEGVEVLPINARVIEFAKALVDEEVMRRKASRDARHIAVCCVHGVDYLLTTNMNDMANERRIRGLKILAKKYGYKPPKILTPEQFIMLGGFHSLSEHLI